MTIPNGTIQIPQLIRVERITLRPWRFEDLPDLLSYAFDEEWGRFLPVPQPYTEGEARRFIAAQLVLPATERSWAIELEQRVIGSIDISFAQRARIGSIGYSLARDHWGKGLATDAARAVIDASFASVPALERIHATVDPANPASARVLEKAGMAREGVLRNFAVFRDQLVDEVWYAILRAEWETRRRSLLS